MTRVKRGAIARRRRKKKNLAVVGAISSNSNLFRIAQQHVIKVMQYSYRDRKERKRLYRSLWLVRFWEVFGQMTVGEDFGDGIQKKMEL